MLNMALWIMLLPKGPLEDILIHPGFERLVLLPGTVQDNASSEILTSPEMKDVIEELIASSFTMTIS